MNFSALHEITSYIPLSYIKYLFTNQPDSVERSWEYNLIVGVRPTSPKIGRQERYTPLFAPHVPKSGTSGAPSCYYTFHHLPTPCRTGGEILR